MAAHVLSKTVLPSDLYAHIYSVPDTVSFIRPIFSFLNTSSLSTKIFMLFTSEPLLYGPVPGSIPSDRVLIEAREGHYCIARLSDFIEYESPLAPKDPLDRTGLVLLPGERVYAKAQIDGVALRMTGLVDATY